MNVTSGFFFATLGDVMKLRSIFPRPNVARHENAAFNVVYSSYISSHMPGGEARRHFWFLKFGSSLEEALTIEAWDTPCIIWKSVDKGYSKIQVEKMIMQENKPVTTYPVRIALDTRLTVCIGGKTLMRVPVHYFQLSDITLRNISRAAGREYIYYNGQPTEPVSHVAPIQYTPVTYAVADFMGPIL